MPIMPPYKKAVPTKIGIKYMGTAMYTLINNRFNHFT